MVLLSKSVHFGDILLEQNEVETLPKALRTQALTCFTSSFGLIWWVGFGMFGSVGLLGYVWFGLVGLVR